MKINQNTSILFWLFKSKRTKDGSSPIYCRITISGLRVEFSTGKKINPDLWISNAGMAKGNTQQALLINKELNKIKADIQRTYDQLEAIHENVSAEMLKNAYLKVDPKNKMAIEAITEFNALLYKRANAKEPTLKIETWKRFETTKLKLKQFIRHHYNLTDKRLTDLKPSFGDDLLLYLTTEDNLVKNTAMKYIKNIKQFFDWATKKEYMNTNILDDFRCTYKNPKRERLIFSELMEMYQKPMPVKRLEEVRDVYVFGCFTGYSYMDLYELTPDNVSIWIDGSKWLIKDRHKGDNNKSNVPLLEIPLQIIDKYKNHPYCITFNKLLPVNSNQRYNAYLKEIAGICGIQKQLTTHTARHTFATTILLENDCPLSSVKEMLGHASTRTTEIYARTTDIKVSNNMKSVKEKLNSKLLLTKTGS